MAGGAGGAGGTWSLVVGTIIFLFLTASLVSVPIFVENRAFFNFGGWGGWTWSLVVGTIIFLFLTASLVPVPIFVENRAFFSALSCQILLILIPQYT